MTILAVHTALQFACQIAVERGAEQRVWLFAASSIASFGRLGVQLALVYLLSDPRTTRFDVVWIIIGYIATFAGRLVAFAALGRSNLRLRKLIPCGLFEGLMFICAQLALLRAGHIVYALHRADYAALAALCVLTCTVGITLAANVVHGKRPPRSARRVRILYVLAAAGYLLLIPLSTGALGHFRSSRALYLLAPDNLTEIHPAAVLLLIAFGPVLLLAGQAAIFLQNRGRRWGRDLKLKEEQRLVEIAFAEQKVTRLQNEALLEEVRERRKAEAELVQAAFHDPVTGLHNRAYLNQRLKERLALRHRSAASALLYLDIDNFKSVNDMLGHSHGDKLLVEAGRRLRTCLGNTDTLASMGSDEYIILLDRMTSCEQGMRFAQRVLRAMEEPFEVAGTTFHLSASIGFCKLEASYSSPEAVLRDADLAMYAAKHKGGAQIAEYTPSMLAEALAAANAKAELTTAIDRNEFVLFYQPIVHLHDGSVYGAEALIRWRHPDRGMVSPGHFIPLAEQTGHIVDIGNWVLQQACTEYAQLKRAAGANLLLSLNVSTRQLELPGFMELLKHVLKDTRVPPGCLQLEITESILLIDPSRMGSLFHQIRALGVKIAFDDFGTGYSSLNYIQRYPVDTLKIDQSFVRALKDGPVNLDIVRLILQLAQVTGMGVCAEGIETEEEAEKLASLGCSIAQGYLFSKPMPLSTCLEYLTQQAEEKFAARI
jgi:diguanylate cyclase (GGDEF)-like protein